MYLFLKHPLSHFSLEKPLYLCAKKINAVRFSIVKLNISANLIHLQCSPHQWRSGNAQNWKMRDAKFKLRSRLSTKSSGVFRGYLRNSSKYGLGSLRKTLTEGTPLVGSSPTSGQLAFNLQPTNHLQCRTSLEICQKMGSLNMRTSLMFLQLFKLINQLKFLNISYHHAFKD